MHISVLLVSLGLGNMAQAQLIGCRYDLHGQLLAAAQTISCFMIFVVICLCSSFL